MLGHFRPVCVNRISMHEIMHIDRLRFLLRQNLFKMDLDTAVEIAEDAPNLLKQLEVLEFYANEKNWQSPSTGFVAQYDPEPSPIGQDLGAKARAALEGKV